MYLSDKYTPRIDLKYVKCASQARRSKANANSQGVKFTDYIFKTIFKMKSFLLKFYWRMFKGV